MAGHEYVPELPNTVVIGGGGGGSRTLEALRPIVRENLTGIVGMFDSGGSTGDVRDVYGGPAWGDLNKNCVALSQLDEDSLMGLQRKLGEGNDSDKLKAHQQSIGNLLLSNYHQLFDGDLERVIAAYSNLYQIQGKVLPVTGENRQLRLTTPWGEVIRGEHEIDMTDIPDLRGSTLWFDEETTISDQAAAALEEADLVVIAPGDWTTSVGPNLAVKGVKERLRKVPAVVSVMNLMNKPGQTKDWNVKTYLDQYKQILDGEQLIDRVIVNTAPLNPEALAIQESEGSTPVLADVEELRKAGYEVAEADLINDKLAGKDPHDRLGNRAQITHGTKSLGRAIMKEWFANEFPDKAAR